MDKQVRQEVADESAVWIRKLQAKIEENEGEQTFTEWGIKYVDDPFTGQDIKKEVKLMVDNECRTTTEPPLINIYFNQLVVKPAHYSFTYKQLVQGLMVQ